MVTKIQIEKGIPIPPDGRGGGVYPWRDMEIGDSFAVPTSKGGLHRAAQRAGIKVTSRKEGDHIRVWRIA